MGLVEGNRKGGICAEEGVGKGSLVSEEGGGADADGIGEVWGDGGEGSVARFGVEGDNAHGDVIAVHERDVIEGLATVRCQGEFGEGCWGVALM